MEKARSDRSLGVDHDVEHYIDNFLAEEEVLRLLRQPSALDRDKSSSRGSPSFFRSTKVLPNFWRSALSESRRVAHGLKGVLAFIDADFKE